MGDKSEETILCERCKDVMDRSEFSVEAFEVSGGLVLCEACADEMYEAGA